MNDNIRAALLVLHVNQTAYALTGAMIRRLVYASTGRGTEIGGGWTVGFGRKAGAEASLASNGRFPRGAALWTSAGQPKLHGARTYVLTEAGRARLNDRVGVLAMNESALAEYDVLAHYTADEAQRYERAQVTQRAAISHARDVVRQERKRARTIAMREANRKAKETRDAEDAAAEWASTQREDAAFMGVLDIVTTLGAKGMTREAALALIRDACDVAAEVGDDEGEGAQIDIG